MDKVRRAKVWTEEQLITAADSSSSWSEVKSALGLSIDGRPTARLREQLRSYGDRYAHLVPNKRERRWTDELIIESARTSTNWNQFYSLLGVERSGGSRNKAKLRALELGCDLTNIKSASRQRVDFGNCSFCGEVLSKRSKFCNSDCNMSFRKNSAASYMQRWMAGEEDGLRKNGTMRTPVRDFLLLEANYACTDCGWDKRHPSDGLPLVTIDHIDGNSYNGYRGNLKVLCPNCHSLTPTYGYRNKGNGRRTVGRQLGYPVG